MIESNIRTALAGQDPMLLPLHHVIETLTGQSSPGKIAEGVGTIATAGAAGGTEGVDAELTAPVAGKKPAAPTEARPVANERPKPDHWDELVEFAGTLPIFEDDNEARGIYVTESVDALREKLWELLDNDALDELRYYGIGTLLCGVARGLRNPEVRRRTIESIGERLYSAYRLAGTRRRKTLLPADIRSDPFAMVFKSMVQDEADRYPPHVRLLNDVLALHEFERELALKRDNPIRGVDPPPRASGDRKHKAGESVMRITSVVASATTRTIRGVLTLRADYLAKQDPDFPEHPTAVEIMERTDMDDINLIPVAQRAAAIRLDEMNKLEDVYLGMDENGRAMFHGKKLSRSKDLLPPEVSTGVVSRTLLHTRRLRCPALFINGLIPDMIDCVIKGVHEADALAQHIQRMKTGTFTFL